MITFVVLGHARTGSTLIIDALSQHPDAKVWGELFTLDTVARVAHASPDRPYDDVEEGGEYLARLFERAARQRYEAAGFKLFFSHGRSGPSSSLWGYLEARYDLRVIQLRRDDLLGCFVSLERAKQSQRWHTRSHEAIVDDPQTVTIAPGALARYFEFITESWRTVEARFAGRPTMTIDYERDLGDRFQHTMDSVFDFLDLRRIAITASYRKHETRGLRSRLANYDELARHFADTSYSRYFSER